MGKPKGGIIPAYAGPTSLKILFRAIVGDHPRIRGAYSAMDCRCALRLGSSPHTRGLLIRIFSETILKRIIPAYAGPTPFVSTFPK